jgi:hypothetical protein
MKGDINCVADTLLLILIIADLANSEGYTPTLAFLAVLDDLLETRLLNDSRGADVYEKLRISQNSNISLPCTPAFCLVSAKGLSLSRSAGQA